VRRFQNAQTGADSLHLLTSANSAAAGILFLRLVVGGCAAARGVRRLRVEDAGDARGLALGALQVVGGVFFAVGLITPFAAYALATVATATLRPYVTRRSRADSYFELQLTILAVALAVTATGPLKGSLDEVLGDLDDRLSGLLWAAGVLAAALLTSLLVGRDEPTGESDRRDPGLA
jgi:uncharacterized membrane protein YphA (DoxX/SURF4 family)